MANAKYIETLLGGLSAETRVALKRIFDYLLKEIRFGRSTGAQSPTENFAGHLYTVTTPATAGQEFSVPHRFASAPYLLIPVLPLDAVNSTLAPLTLTRPADANRIYLSSTATSATVCFYVEG